MLLVQKMRCGSPFNVKSRFATTLDIKIFLTLSNHNLLTFLNMKMTKELNINYKDYLSEIFDQPSKIHKAYNFFHKYSYNNQILAMTQLFTIEPINSFNGWKKLGRNVKKGSKAISLYLPIVKKTKDPEDENNVITKTSFIMKKNWFSLSQTEGKEFEIESSPEFCLDKALNSLNIKQESFQMLNGNCQGYAIPNEGKIAINPVAYNPFKTAIHEIAHCLLHKDKSQIVDGRMLDRSIEEFEAETTAYLVSSSLGKIKDLEYSRGYIADWINEDDIKEANFKRAIQAAHEILSAGSS